MTIQPGRKSGRLRSIAWLAVFGVFALGVAALAVTTVWDVAIGRWIDLPLDFIFGGACATVAWFAFRHHELALRSRRL